LHVVGRCEEVVAPLQRGLGEGRIGEMRDVGDAGLLLLDLDLLVELTRHALEIRDHCFNLRDLPALLVDLEFLEPDQALAAGLHRLVLLTQSSPATAARPASLPPFPRSLPASCSHRQSKCALPVAGSKTPPAPG